MTPDGAEGTVTGVTEILDGTEAPTALFATTVNIYVWPLVKPVIVTDVPLVVLVNPPGFELTV